MINVRIKLELTIKVSYDLVQNDGFTRMSRNKLRISRGISFMNLDAYSPTKQMERRKVWRHLGSCSSTLAQKRCLFTWRKRVPADTLRRVAANRHKGAKWVPCCMWEACLDCDLAGVLTPPHLLSSSVFPRDSCAPSVVHGRVVKMLLPHLFSSLPSSPSFPYSLFPRLPSPTRSPMFLFTSPRTCVVLAHAVCARMTAERGAYARERACPWTGAASAPHSPLEKSRDVVDCYSRSGSESALSVGTPPPHP